MAKRVLLVVPSSQPPPLRGRRVALLRLVAVVLTGGALAGAMSCGALVLVGSPSLGTLAIVALGCVTASLLSLLLTEVVLGRRLQRLALFIEERARQKKRIGPPVGDEDLARLIGVVDRLIAESAMPTADSTGPRTTLPSSASGGTPAVSPRELALTETLAERTTELERRLGERALLFDLLRETIASPRLDDVLNLLSSRLGTALDLREIAILIRAEDGRFVVRSAWGFADCEAVLGRSIAPNEGATGASTQLGQPVVIDDVAGAPNYLAFWGEVARTGSFMSTPIRVHGKTIGALALTRPPHAPLTEAEVHFVAAVADHVALAIHNAQLYRDLEVLSTHDELTKLLNRRGFSERLAAEMAEARRFGHALSMLMIDVDHFKKLNDRAGHLLGDEALIAVARTLASSVRSIDTVARWGGEEFTILLSRAGQAEAKEVGEKLRGLVASIDASWSREQPFGHVSVSIGVAELAPGEDAASFIDRADRAVYTAKREGRNRVSGGLPARQGQG